MGALGPLKQAGWQTSDTQILPKARPGEQLLVSCASKKLHLYEPLLPNGLAVGQSSIHYLLGAPRSLVRCQPPGIQPRTSPGPRDETPTFQCRLHLGSGSRRLCGGREGFRGLQKGHHGIKVDTKFTASKGLLFPLPPRSGGKSLAGRPQSPGQGRAVQPPPRPEKPPARGPGRGDPGRVHPPRALGRTRGPGSRRGMGPREGGRGRGRVGREGETGPRPPAGGRGR